MRPSIAVALLLAAAPAAAQDGRVVFESRCASCHAVVATAPPGPGPNLMGVIGRRVGGDPAFDYSSVLEAARDAGLVWHSARLESFLADPDAMFPGLWMGANGLRAAADRAAVVGYLQTAR